MDLLTASSNEPWGEQGDDWEGGKERAKEDMSEKTHYH